MDRREERRDCPTSVVERYAENFHENFSAEMPIKYPPMKKFHLMKVARRRKSALKIFHTSAVRQKTKKAKGKSERREWGVGGRCPQWGVLSATSTGYDKVAHSLPTATTPRHCLCPLLPPPALSTGYLFQHIWKPNFLPAAPCANYDDAAKMPSIAAQRTCLCVMPKSSNGANIKQKAPASSTL